MILILGAIFIFVLVFFFIKFCNKYSILQNYSGEKHQKYTASKNIPLIGGSISLIFIIIFTEFNILLKLFLTSIFVIGTLSDLKILVSPTKRLLVQFTVLIFFLYTLDIHLVETRFIFLDLLLNNIAFSFIFTAFCMLVLINGTNFIDGNNGNVLIYYFIISVFVFLLNKNGLNSVSIENIFFIMELIVILLIFNFLNKLYLGDGGSFLFGSLFGVILVELYLNNIKIISSFFVILVLWYPSFENLFSILRKFYFAKSPVEADNNHLHQLLYFFLIKKINLNKIFINNSVSFIINFYNFIIILIGFSNPNFTQLLILLILLNIIFYILIYFSLLKFKKNYSKK